MTGETSTPAQSPSGRDTATAATSRINPSPAQADDRDKADARRVERHLRKIESAWDSYLD